VSGKARGGQGGKKKKHPKRFSLGKTSRPWPRGKCLAMLMCKKGTWQSRKKVPPKRCKRGVWETFPPNDSLVEMKSPGTGNTKGENIEEMVNRFTRTLGKLKKKQQDIKKGGEGTAKTKETLQKKEKKRVRWKKWGSSATRAAKDVGPQNPIHRSGFGWGRPRCTKTSSRGPTKRGKRCRCALKKTAMGVVVRTYESEISEGGCTGGGKRAPRRGGKKLQIQE